MKINKSSSPSLLARLVLVLAVLALTVFLGGTGTGTGGNQKKFPAAVVLAMPIVGSEDSGSVESDSDSDSDSSEDSGSDDDHGGCTVVQKTTVTLDDDPRSPGASPVEVDFYDCADESNGKGSKGNNGKDKDKVLIVFSCGLGVPKALYETFAEGLVRTSTSSSSLDYQIAVIEHLVPSFFGPFPINTVNALDVSNTIAKADEMEEMEDGYDSTTSTSSSTKKKTKNRKIVLMGHSFGGGTTLNAIEGSCPFPFCFGSDPWTPPGVPNFLPVPVPRHPDVVMGVAYGFSLNDRLGQCPDPFSRLRNVDGIPFKVVNGAGDINFFTSLKCTNNGDGTVVEVEENLTTGSFDRLNPTKVFATIDNLDHYSISQEITNFRRGDVLSTLERNEQISTVVDSIGFVLKQSLKKNNPTKNLCNQLSGRGDEVGYDVVDCLEEYLYAS